MDPPKFPVREQGPETGLVRLRKCYSKTCMDRNPGRTPSDAHPTSQQKRHPVRSAFSNGGAEIFEGLPVLRSAVLGCNSLFIRQLTGKKQAFEKFILWILRYCENFISLLRNICQKHSKFPAQRNREISGKYQARNRELLSSMYCFFNQRFKVIFNISISIIPIRVKAFDRIRQRNAI